MPSKAFGRSASQIILNCLKLCLLREWFSDIFFSQGSLWSKAALDHLACHHKSRLGNHDTTCAQHLQESEKRSMKANCISPFTQMLSEFLLMLFHIVFVCICSPSDCRYCFVIQDALARAAPTNDPNVPLHALEKNTATTQRGCKEEHTITMRNHSHILARFQPLQPVQRQRCSIGWSRSFLVASLPC